MAELQIQSQEHDVTIVLGEDRIVLREGRLDPATVPEVDAFVVTALEPGPWTFPGVDRVSAPPNLSASAWRQLRDRTRARNANSGHFLDDAAAALATAYLVEVNDKRLLIPGSTWDAVQLGLNEDYLPVDFVLLRDIAIPPGLLDRLLLRDGQPHAVALVLGSTATHAELSSRCAKVHERGSTITL